MWVPLVARNEPAGDQNTIKGAIRFWKKTMTYSNPCSIHTRTMAFWHHDDVIKWKHFLHYWPFVQGIHPSLVNSLQNFDVFFDLCLNKWLSKNRDASDLRCHHAHYDVNVMISVTYPKGFHRVKFVIIPPCFFISAIFVKYCYTTGSLLFRLLTAGEKIIVF